MLTCTLDYRTINVDGVLLQFEITDPNGALVRAVDQSPTRSDLFVSILGGVPDILFDRGGVYRCTVRMRFLEQVSFFILNSANLVGSGTLDIEVEGEESLS